MAPPPPQLMEKLVEEILLRFAPDDPTSLVSAALICKLWCRLVCAASFRRRFLEFHHGTAPVLGLLYGDTCNIRHDDTYFVPMTSFRSMRTADVRHGWHAIDARHGRVLLCQKDHRFKDSHGDLCIWEPITDEQQDLPEPPFCMQIAAVACAATAGGDCDHLDCRRGPFLVVVMKIKYHKMYLSVYSSDDEAWSKITVCDVPNANSNIMYSSVPGILIGSALYILVHYDHEVLVKHEYETIVNHEIMKYDLATQQLCTICLPSKFRRWKRSIMVMSDDDGGLGFVVNVKNKLQLWSKVAVADGDAGFVLTRVIDLWKVLPSGALIKKKKQPQVYGFADGVDSRVLFIRTFDGLYSIEVNSSQVKRVANCCGDHYVIPYISLCTPTSTVWVQI